MASAAAKKLAREIPPLPPVLSGRRAIDCVPSRPGNDSFVRAMRIVMFCSTEANCGSPIGTLGRISLECLLRSHIRFYRLFPASILRALLCGWSTSKAPRSGH